MFCDGVSYCFAGIYAMTARIISLDAAIEAVLNIRHAAAGNFAPEFSGNQGEAYDRAVLDIHKALSALPAVDGWPSLQQAMNELNATKDALAEAEARIYSLEDALQYPRD